MPVHLQSNSACERMIKRDIARTFPDHSFFKDKDGIGQGTLFNVIKVHDLLKLNRIHDAIYYFYV